MKELYGEGLATHADPESCVGSRKGAGEALTGAHAGGAIELRKHQSRVPTLLQHAEGNTGPRKSASAGLTRRSRRTLACVESPCARTGRSAVRPRKMAWWATTGRLRP
jgi:hypothetical protein